MIITVWIVASVVGLPVLFGVNTHADDVILFTFLLNFSFLNVRKIDYCKSLGQQEGKKESK